MIPSILLVTGPSPSGKTRLSEYLAELAGPRVAYIESSASSSMCRDVRIADPDLVVVDPFDARRASVELCALVLGRRRATVVTSTDHWSAWTVLADSQRVRRLIGQIVAKAQRLELGP